MCLYDDTPLPQRFNHIREKVVWSSISVTAAHLASDVLAVFFREPWERNRQVEVVRIMDPGDAAQAGSKRLFVVFFCSNEGGEGDRMKIGGLAFCFLVVIKLPGMTNKARQRGKGGRHTNKNDGGKREGECPEQRRRATEMRAHKTKTNTFPTVEHHSSLFTIKFPESICLLFCLCRWGS